MNIQEAKDEIIRSVQAYTARDARGFYRIPPVRQRPVLLMGPPGIGKTAIMEQAARECGVGLVAYTITHHTRQSAVGLPQLVKRTFEGTEYTVTEYTMSEIVGAVYEYQERTGHKEGILFIDEINCVSETLAPTMLQFLQYKMFGNHKVPEGWMIVAAGNPPECNRSVRELDMAALDRVRVLNVEAEFSVWKDYALSAGVHPAILSYLELHPEYFYQVTLTRDKREFVTARGWEDLSVLLTEYERQDLPAGVSFMEEFLRIKEIASDFASYYQMYRSYTGRYKVLALAAGSLTEQETDELSALLKEASGDIRCMFVRHLLAAASERMCTYARNQKLFRRKKEVLGQLGAYMKKEDASWEGFFKKRFQEMQIKKQNGLLEPWEEGMECQVDENLKTFLFADQSLVSKSIINESSAEEGLTEELRQLEKQKSELCEFLGRITDFLSGAFGEDLELTDWLWGIKNHGDFKNCGYTIKPEFLALLDEKGQEERLRKNILQMEGLYETADRV